jgi:hypothetical protein
VRKGCKDVVHPKKDTALAPVRQREHFQMLVAELRGESEMDDGRLAAADRRCPDPTGPPASARPDHPGETRRHQVLHAYRKDTPLQDPQLVVWLREGREQPPGLLDPRRPRPPVPTDPTVLENWLRD